MITPNLMKLSSIKLYYLLFKTRLKQLQKLLPDFRIIRSYTHLSNDILLRHPGDLVFLLIPERVAIFASLDELPSLDEDDVLGRNGIRGDDTKVVSAVATAISGKLKERKIRRSQLQNSYWLHFINFFIIKNLLVGAGGFSVFVFCWQDPIACQQSRIPGTMLPRSSSNFSPWHGQDANDKSQVAEIWRWSSQRLFRAGSSTSLHPSSRIHGRKRPRKIRTLSRRSGSKRAGAYFIFENGGARMTEGDSGLQKNQKKNVDSKYFLEFNKTSLFILHCLWDKEKEERDSCSV